MPTPDQDAVCWNTHGSFRCECSGKCYDGSILVLDAFYKDVFVQTPMGTMKTKKSFLRPPVSIDGKGKSSYITCLTKDPVSIIRGSCSITWHNKVYVYGKSKQITRLDGTHLNVVGTLPLNWNEMTGACSTTDSFLFLCFFEKHDECYQAEDPLGPFTMIEKSHFPHWRTLTSASDSKLYRVVRKL